MQSKGKSDVEELMSTFSLIYFTLCFAFAVIILWPRQLRARKSLFGVYNFRVRSVTVVAEARLVRHGAGTAAASSSGLATQVQGRAKWEWHDGLLKP